MSNLPQSILRTALTTLGVSIGIASLAGMLSLGVGLQEQVVGRFFQSGGFDTITVIAPNIVGVAGSILAGRGGPRGRGGFGGNPESTAQNLTDETVKQLSALE